MINATLRFLAEKTPILNEILGPNIKSIRDGTIEIYDIRNTEWTTALKYLNSKGITTCTMPPTLFEVSPKPAIEDVVAFHLSDDWGDTVENPSADLSSGCRACGTVQLGRPLIVNYVPQGHVIGVGCETATSERFFQLFGKDELVRAGGIVRHLGKNFRYCRIRVQQEHRILADVSLCRPINCLTCGRPRRLSISGVLVGDELMDDFDIAVDSRLRIAHEADHEIFVSKHMAIEIRQELGKTGYVLNPVYSSQSDIGQLVTNFKEAVDELFTLTH